MILVVFILLDVFFLIFNGKIDCCVLLVFDIVFVVLLIIYVMLIMEIE